MSTEAFETLKASLQLLREKLPASTGIEREKIEECIQYGDKILRTLLADPANQPVEQEV